MVAGVKTRVLVGLFGLLSLIVIFLIARYWNIYFHDIRVVNELPGYRVGLVNREPLEEYLRNHGFLGSDGYKKIAVVFTNEVENPVFVESDASGNPLISAESGFKDGLLVIWVAVSEDAFDVVDADRHGTWLTKVFWEMVNINQRRMTDSINRDIEPMSIELFTIRKK